MNAAKSSHSAARPFFWASHNFVGGPTTVRLTGYPSVHSDDDFSINGVSRPESGRSRAACSAGATPPFISEVFA